MEMVSFLAGEPWSDMPACSSRIITTYCQIINDNSGQAVRDRLQTYVPRLIGTASSEHEAKRAEYMMWQAIKVHLPLLCGYAKLRTCVNELESIPSGEFATVRNRIRYVINYAISHSDKDARAVAKFAENFLYAVKEIKFASYKITECVADMGVALARVTGDWDPVFDTLDGVIAVGPSGESYSDNHLKRAKLLKEQVTNQTSMSSDVKEIS